MLGGNMTKIHYLVASIISLVCLAFIIFHLKFPNIIFDEKILILLGIAILPWMTFFFKRFKVGPVEGETLGRAQGKTDKPLPPKEEYIKEERISVVSGEKLSLDAKKVLATLWKFQKQSLMDF